jgi:co-chaperonin GroES (HSP10)
MGGAVRPIRDKVLVEMLKSTHDYLVLPECYVEATRMADVIAVGEGVTGVDAGDRVLMIEGVRGYPTDYGRVIKEEWILGAIDE